MAGSFHGVMLVSGLAPVVGDNPKVLVLGTMPGVRSLEEQQYYAHPRNHFWPIMAELLREPLPNTYHDRLQMVKDHGVALWDTLAHCHRPGSLDSAISAEVPNPIADLLALHPTIGHVVLNGGAAARYFHRFNVVPAHIGIHHMPSTSPAYTLPLAQKLAAWQVIQTYL